MSAARRALLLAALAAGTARPAAAQGAPQLQARGTTPGGLAASLNALGARSNAGTVGVVSGGIDGTYARIAADLAAVLDDGEQLRVLPILGKGSLQNLSDIMVLRGVDIGIVQSDVLAYARRERLLPGVDQLIQYIAKLYDEEVHVLAAPAVRSLADLAGKPVNIDVRGSGTAMTATLVLDGVGIQPRHAPQDTALEQLRRGEIAALVYVAGKPARLFSGIPAESGLHFLPVPATPALLETYLPSTLARSDYPSLISDEAVETIAVGAVMAAYAWQPGTERHRKVGRFVEAFFARFSEFLRPPRHPKWREVDLAAQVPGWVRFGPAAARVAAGR